MNEIEAFIAKTSGIKHSTRLDFLQARSRDYYWYSPILKKELDDVRADIVVMPANEEQVLQVLAACHDLELPLTPRGRGTGNYGQAMPLAGGVVMDMSLMRKVEYLDRDRVRVLAGAQIGDIDKQARTM